MLSRILKKALYIGLGALLLAACHSTTEEKKEPHDDMKKSSHTNKTGIQFGLLFMRH